MTSAARSSRRRGPRPTAIELIVDVLGIGDPVGRSIPAEAAPEQRQAGDVDAAGHDGDLGVDDWIQPVSPTCVRVTDMITRITPMPTRMSGHHDPRSIAGMNWRRERSRR